MLDGCYSQETQCRRSCSRFTRYQDTKVLKPDLLLAQERLLGVATSFLIGMAWIGRGHGGPVRHFRLCGSWPPRVFQIARG